MKIRFEDGLPFVTLAVTYLEQQITLNRVLLDTGSASTILAIDKVESIGLRPEPHDAIHRIRGVGGAEYVFSKRVERLALGTIEILDFEVEIGAMNYGFDIEGILGLDFLLAAEVVIDLRQRKVRQNRRSTR
ncbi:MAG TPA: retropepsin-like aspartic protease [Chthonomonadaceae bacterium]|nr:retropepsin-like aspartic protease [Chthonomonadaceae bacterium]